MNIPNATEGEAADKRSLIITHATRLFNEQGYADTRLEDISEGLGATKTSISYYFKSKEGLLKEAYEEALAFSELALESAQLARNGRAAVLHWVREHARAQCQSLDGMRQPIALLGDLQSLDESVAQSLTRRYRDLVEHCGELLTRGQDDGSINVKCVDATLFFLVNMIHWLPRWLACLQPDSASRSIDGLIDLLERGLAEDRSRPTAPPINAASSAELDSIFDREARNRLKREAFLRTGTRALNERGYRSLSLNDIAAELGVTRGAFYYHIADKESLLRGCFERTCNLISKAQDHASRDGLTGLDHLERALRWLYDRQVSNLDPLLRPGLLHALEGKSRSVIDARLGELRSRFGYMIANAVMDGSARAVPVAGADQLVMGSIFAGSHRRMSLMPAAKRDSLAPGFSSVAYFETLFYGLAGRAESTRRTHHSGSDSDS